MYIDKYAKGAATVTSVQAYPFQEKDFKAYLSKIKDENVDAIFSSGYYFQTGPVVKQAREMGIKAHIIGEEGQTHQVLRNCRKIGRRFYNRHQPQP